MELKKSIDTTTLTFEDRNKIYTVKINLKVINNMTQNTVKAQFNETGGILIGHYEGNPSTAYITEATPQPNDSKSSRFRFLRGTEGLKEKLDLAWSKGNYYLGEWHYHPHGSTTPSVTDATEMKNISLNKHLFCANPILVIIGDGNLSVNYSISIINNGKLELLSQI